MDLEKYIEYLKTMDKKFHWPIERYESQIPKRKKIHKKFPFVITYAEHYGSGCLLDDISDWCREHYGDRDGECHWRKCSLSYDTWYYGNRFEEQLDKQLEKCKKREEDGIIDAHFEMIKNRPDIPKKHHHTGIWTTFFVVKTGYDYGYEDFCFKNAEDALHFKLIWDHEVQRRK